MKAVTFIVPTTARNPVGGYKIIFEYANALSEKGYTVNLIFPNHIEKFGKKSWKNFIKYPLFKFTKIYGPKKWFDLNERIHCMYLWELTDTKIPDANIVIATACETAEFVNKCSKQKGKKYYFIQSYEDWSIQEDELIKTWKMPMQKIVISKALLKKAYQLGEQATYIPNGLNHDEFYIDNSIYKEKNTLMMLYHTNEAVKQSNKALEKLVELKKHNPAIKLILFSTQARPGHIPEWVEYYQLPNKELLRSLYNRATLFIAPSAIEGWALPPAEAMMCGTAVCVTEIDGHEYVKDGETGYLINSDLSNLVTVVKKILTDSIKLDQTAKNGNEYIKQFTWEKSIEKFIEVIE